MRSFGILFAVLAATSVSAEAVFATKTIRARDVITLDSVEIHNEVVANAARSLDDVIGSEAKRAIYAGYPVLLDNLARPALVERNDIVPTSFDIKGLSIVTEARSLERGAEGDIIRAMNLISRKTILAEVQKDGSLKALP